MVSPADVRLLLVDDMEETRYLLRRRLIAMGFTQTTMARNARAAPHACPRKRAVTRTMANARPALRSNPSHNTARNDA